MEYTPQGPDKKNLQKPAADLSVHGAAMESHLAVQDPKQGEREYFHRIGEAGRAHAAKKPFGDVNCPQYLMNLSAILSLMRPPPARVVEFGCGSGWLSLLLSEQGYEVLGFDISQEAIAIAQALQNSRGIRNACFQVADYEEIHVGASADYALFHDALHHCESEVAALQTAYDALAPHGMLICIEPGDGHQSSPQSKYVVEHFGVHEKDMPPRKIVAVAKKVGFRRHLILPWPWFFLRSTYRSGYLDASTQSDLRGRKLLSLWYLFRSFFRTKAQGLVLLWKE